MSVADPAERWARAALSRICETPQPALVALVEARGADAVWAGLRAGEALLEPRTMAALLPRVEITEPERDLARLHELGGRLLVPGDPEWPAAVDELTAPDAAPFALWVRGPLSLADVARRAVAVVGSRAATEYGLYVAGELSAALAERGFAIVSGGAYGIDGAAHRGCLAVEGRTVVVLASGVDVHYPRGHTALLERVGSSGLLVSEFPPGAAPHRGRFLQRNRLIAALAGGVVVVEAGHRSGAMSTAAHARRLRRPVMALPGPVTSAMSAGCHRLIRETGAVLVTGAADVAELAGRIGADLAPASNPAPGARDGLPPEVKRVLDAVPVRRAVPVERIVITAGLDPATVLGALGLLTGLGFVEALPAGYRLVATGGSA